MTGAIAFFPWVIANEVLELPGLRLLPYRFRKSPGNQPYAAQKDIDDVLSAYSNRPRARIREATLLETGEWKTGQDADQHVEALLQTRELIGFCALVNRRLFARVSHYTNFDAYSLVVQRFRAGDARTFVFPTRRRDGFGQHFWGADEFVHFRPDHVDGNSYLDVDAALLTALLQIPEQLPEVMDAIVQFNRANTDSAAMPEHAELVMLKVAFEALLGADHHADTFVEKLKGVAGPLAATVDGPMAQAWQDRWPKAARPLEAWARDICIARNAAAHAGLKGRSKPVWPDRLHLAFGALLFPLLVKQVMATKNLLPMDETAAGKLKRIDAYLMHNPFAFNWLKAGNQKHPWTIVDNQASGEVMSKRLYKEVTRVLGRADGLQKKPPASAG